MEGKERKKSKIPASFKVGAISSAFLIIGYQAALLIHSTAVSSIVAHRDEPDTVFVIDKSLAIKVLEESGLEPAPINGRGVKDASDESIVIRKASSHSEMAESIADKHGKRVVENFAFNPNTASPEDFQRLGFSEKQAQAIINYRDKGGRFRRPSDFAKSFVVADSVFKRLEPFIDIPKVDINIADSTALDALPGIGPYFASKIVSYRNELHGFSYPEQLMDIYNFDRDKYDGLKDLITVSEPVPYPIWTLPEKELEKHPYIGKYSAHSIVVFRDNNVREALTVEGLVKAGIIKKESAAKLIRCRIASPE